MTSIADSSPLETLAERRKLSTNPEKLKLITKEPIKQSNQTLQRLEQENAKLPPQDSEEYLLSRLERQNILLNADPKSVCIESNRLQADFNTTRRLVTDATFSPIHSNHEESIQALLADSPITEINKEDEWDFWQAIVEDYTAAATKLPHLLAAKLRYGGIPHKIRGVIWQSMAQSSSLNLESLYVQLSKEPSSYERIIKRDLSRTFPQLSMFKADGGEGQLALGRILKAYSIYDLHVGYCQGLAFLAGPLLMTMPEDQAFCTFVRLMETYEMRTMFTLNMEGLHLRLYQFQTLLVEHCPRLAAHLESHSINTAMYASQWYLTLFAYTFPISLVLRVYDLVFAEGAVETITRVAVAIMQKNEETLLGMDEFENLMIYLSSRDLYQTTYKSDPEAVIHDAMGLSTIISRKKMEEISKGYQEKVAEEKKQAQLALRSNSWSKRESWFNWGQKSTDWSEPPETPWLEQVGQQRVMEEAREQQPSPVESSGSDTLDEVTSELVSVKLANFEMGQKYQTLCQDHDQTCRKLKDLQEGQGALIEKLMELQTTLRLNKSENERLLDEQNRWFEEKEELEEKNAAAKRTLADLQMEKINLDGDCQGYKKRIQELEDQRREYLMPRGSFTEEVFAAHKTLFGTPTPRNDPVEQDKYQEKYIQSDLRCRELEKLLAEAKFKIVECEANHTTDRPRKSLQAGRPTSLQVKRGSLSALMSKNSPSSPSFIEYGRESTDSLRSVTSTASQKRSSVYSRFVNALSSGPISEQITE